MNCYQKSCQFIQILFPGVWKLMPSMLKSWMTSRWKSSCIWVNQSLSVETVVICAVQEFDRADALYQQGMKVDPGNANLLVGDPKKQFIAVLINAVWSCKDVIMVLGQQICYEQFLDFKSWIMLLGLVGVTWSGFDPYLYLCLFSKVFVFNFRSTGAWSHCKLRAM